MYLIFGFFAFPAFFVGLVSPKMWICLLAAVVFAVLPLGFVYTIGSAILQDDKSLRGFFVFLFAGESIIAFAVAGTPVLIGQIVRRWAFARRN
jgi:ABC-type uncharacterized transport system permease subunit